MTYAPESGYESSIAEYVAAVDDVPGWFFPPDTLLFAAVNELQGELGIAGDVLEIGAFQGRCAILLGRFVRPGERLVVCDLFESMEGISSENEQERLSYSELHDLPVPRRRDFEEHFLRYHPQLPLVLQVASARLEEYLPPSTFRLVHIDGGHALDVVRRDIATARRLLGPRGVVVFDDWANSQEPGVALAVWQEYSKGELIPLCFTPSKLYATWDPEGLRPEQLQAWAASEPDVAVSHPHDLDGRQACYVTMTPEYWQRRFPGPGG